MDFSFCAARQFLLQRNQFAFAVTNLLLEGLTCFCLVQFAFAILQFAFVVINLVLPCRFTVGHCKKTLNVMFVTPSVL